MKIIFNKKPFFKFKIFFIVLFILLLLVPKISFAGTEEVFEDGFYRAPDGTAIVQLPELDEENWTVQLNTKSNYRVLQLTLGKKNWRGYINILFPPKDVKYTNDKDVAQGLTTLVNSVKQNADWLKETGEITKGKLSEGIFFSQHLEGTTKNNVQDVADVSIITDGTYLVAIIIRGNKTDYNKDIKETTVSILKSLKVGKTVPWLKDLKPTTVLEGVYLGPYKSGNQYWYIFDKRGYMLAHSPNGLLTLDFDARLQSLGTKINTYSIKNNKININWYDGTNSNYPIQISAKKIIVNNEEYDKVDGLTEGLKLNGHYECSSYYSSTTDTFSFSSSSNYYFTKDGKFSFDSIASANSVSKDTYNNTESSINTYLGKNPSAGIYKIQKDKLWLYFADGTTIYKTFYVNVYNGKPDYNLVYIGGGNYLLDK